MDPTYLYGSASSSAENVAMNSASSPQSAETPAAAQVPGQDQLRCMYRSKLCTNPRAMKLNGELHLLCSYHRKRANLNQQRVHQRRKIRSKERSASAGESAVCEVLEPATSPAGDLAAHDLKILEVLLFFSNSPSNSRNNSFDSSDGRSSGSTGSNCSLHVADRDRHASDVDMRGLERAAR